MKVYPVSPVTLDDGSLFSLSSFIKPERAQPVALEQHDSAFSSFTISSEEVSLSVAAKLNVSNIFKGSIEADDFGLIFDAIAYTDKFLTANVNDSPVIMTRWGAGMRVALRVSGLKGTVGTDFATVAASAQLNNARANYEIKGLGLGIEAFSEILDDLPALGEFGVDAYSNLTGGVYSSLQKYIIEHKASLTPVPIAVGLSDDIESDPVVDGRSVYLCMYWRDRGKGEEWVLERFPDVDKKIAKKVFSLSERQVDKWLEVK